MERARQLLEDPLAQASHRAGETKRAGARSDRAPRVNVRTALIPLTIVALAAVLRLWMLEADAQNPFYDAAVRSMGLSWHNFFFGALTPQGSIAIDKPPVDLWLQVASTKLLGFNRAALALPEALGGIAAVALLYGAMTRACGRLAGASSALALALAPIAVLTARSDTMDSLMSALLVGALWAAVVGLQRKRGAYVFASAALVGAAFDVKLAQALIPLPALAFLWWSSARGSRRLGVAAGAAAALVATAMAWAFAASLTPAAHRPVPMGSHQTGSIYRAIFVFNGVERLTGSSQGLAPIGFRSPPGPTRLLSSARPGYASLIGLELVGALALLAAAGARWRLGGAGPRRGTEQERFARLLAWALIVWLATGCVLFSFMKRLEPRYLEAMSPAVAAALGMGGAYLWRHAQTRMGAWLCAAALAVNAAFAALTVHAGDIGVLVCLAASLAAIVLLLPQGVRRRTQARPRRALLLALAALALLAAPADASIDLVEAHAGDANPGGSGSQYSNYLRAHQGSARYEVAATNPLSVVELIAQDGRPVLILRSVDGVLVSVHRLAQLVREGAVRFVIIAHPCSSGRHCTPTTAWSVRHSVQVRRGLYRYR